MDPSAVAVDDKDLGMHPPSYKLRPHILSPFETLAQSVSTIAPCTSATLTIPLVFTLAGEGTWLAYALAMAGLVLVALCIAAFARDSASPGSLYVYTRSTLPPIFGAVSAWALFFAYVTTAASVTGGFITYAYVFLGRLGPHVSPVLLGAVAIGSSVWISHRDIKISAQVMLWIEVVSVCLIAFVIAVVLWRGGLHLDPPQLHLGVVSPVGLRLGIMLALFSFVGFESATTLGAEAREPLKTIPRAVVSSALLAGIFFVVCAYGEALGFRTSAHNLGESIAPMRYLSTRVGVGIVGPIIDAGVLISMFAATLSCVIAAARVLMLMAEHGLAQERLARTHPHHKTPGAAGLLSGLLAFIPVAILGYGGSSGVEIYGWMGTLAVYGFLTAYGLVSVALPVHLRRQSRLNARVLILSITAAGAMLVAILGNLFPVPPAPYRYLPYVYAVYLAAGMLWYALSTRRRALTI